MSAYQRVRQWNTFAQVWHLFDAKWQNPFQSAPVIAKHLKGTHKPIYHPLADTGDHVVVINSRHVALPGDEWRRRSYFHHTGYPGGATWTMAWELHEKDPTMVMKKAVYRALDKNLMRRNLMMRLHIFPEEDIPEEVKANISHQIPVLRPVPRSLLTYTDEEIANFPKVVDYPEGYVVK
ncbi:39S ribosomal protein L13, mitochondrial-like [Homalodisca vitripennis]|uniref:39S ribosomal protein L13, mitochondrial n=1 Tax=Homalodisca liturata TaxID=320908 RepID=A0A1B6JBA2_9HEMI|nr:39S ribosomal protein L13, mitochondrial-like [Homalodisca vitripennis]